MVNLLYRREALERYGSADRVDRLLHITNSKSWLALLALAIALFAALSWAILGSVPVNVAGSGIIRFHVGGTRAVVARQAGTLAEVLVQPGARVEKGQVIALLSMEDVRQQANNSRVELAALRRERNALLDYYRGYMGEQERLLREQTARQRELVAGAEQRLKMQRDLVEGVARLRESGFATLIQDQAAREKLLSQTQDRDQAVIGLVKVNVDRQSLNGQRDREVRILSEKIVATEGELRRLSDLLRTGEKVRAPVSGWVVEFPAQLNSVVAAGTTVALIEYGQFRPTAVIYVPASEGKMVVNDMRVHVTPTTVRPEQYGSIVGQVESVGQYPATPSDMMRVLNNQTLVEAFSAAGPPLEVRVRLGVDAATASGFTWTSGTGAPTPVTSGTLALGRVAVQNDPPITLVIPYLKRFFGI